MQQRGWKREGQTLRLLETLIVPAAAEEVAAAMEVVGLVEVVDEDMAGS